MLAYSRGGIRQHVYTALTLSSLDRHTVKACKASLRWGREVCRIERTDWTAFGASHGGALATLSRACTSSLLITAKPSLATANNTDGEDLWSRNNEGFA